MKIVKDQDKRGFYVSRDSFEKDMKPYTKGNVKRDKVSGASIIKILFVVWNIYALLTWFAPEALIKIRDFIIPSAIENSNSPISRIDNFSKSAVNPTLISSSFIAKQEEAFNYAKLISRSDSYIIEIISRLNFHMSGENYNSELLNKDIEAIEEMKLDIVTNNQDFKDLHLAEHHYLSIIQLMLINIKNDLPVYENIPGANDYINKLSNVSRIELVELLDSNQIFNKTNEDNNIEYSIVRVR